MRIDSQQHFWIYNQTGYEWMKGPFEQLQRDFLPVALNPLGSDAPFCDPLVAVPGAP
ncbi:MAG: hypothetical protein KGM47_01570 [Acidobacteriota bacterium]|nr:hypothetical protein [Acidobacteriota bacterium]